MLDQIPANNLNIETKPDPRELYGSQVFSYTDNVLQIFTQDDQLIDLELAIDKFAVLATNDVPAAKKQWADPKVRDFIFHYVRHFMKTDLFVARMRVMMLQHVLVHTGTYPDAPAIIERVLCQTNINRSAKELQTICNTADHHAMRLQLIRAKVNEAILRVMSDHMVIDDD